ncbi:glycosyltransferase family 4 protein [Arcobacter sp. KX21116]|uniref:glycosyltransferase family 4 protein n=1 Tax=Arcobacter iocasae TaxID=2906515 RepID=UPI0035D49824
MKILFTTPIFGFPSIGGPELRIETSIKALAKISTLICYIRKPKLSLTSEADDFLNDLSERVYYLDPHIPKDVFWPQILENEKPDLIWFGYGNISYVLMKYLKSITNIPLVCDTDSVWSKFILRELDVENNEKRKIEILDAGKIKENEEESWVDFCDVTTAVSEIDMEYYKSLTKDKNKIHLFSNVIDLSSYQNCIENIYNITSPSLYLAGTFWKNSPMEDATRWFVDEVFSNLIIKYPNLKLYIVGKKSIEIVGELSNQNILVVGKVESVLPYLKHVDVVLVPLRFESGTRFKILEAMACKKAIVSTTLGAEGIPVTDNENILIADEPNIFYQKVVDLIENKLTKNKLAKNGYNLVKEQYDIDNLAQQGKAICKYLGLIND